MENKFKTKDLSEAAVLVALGQKLDSIIREGKICWFIFSDSSSCKKIADDFWFGECRVNARNYYEVITKLKNRIFSGD